MKFEVKLEVDPQTMDVDMGRVIQVGSTGTAVTEEEALEMLAECGIITPVCASDGTLYTLNDKIVTI